MKRLISILPLTAVLLTGCAQNRDARMSDNSTANGNTAGANSEISSIEKATPKTSSSELLGLTWYSSIDTAAKVMTAYRLDDRSEEVGSNGQMQTLLDYDDVRLYDQPCDVTLVFTEQGLISITYHAEEDNYNAWSSRLIKLFGTPSQDEDGRLLWNDPMQDGMTAVLLTSTPDDVKDEEIKITFFADAE